MPEKRRDNKGRILRNGEVQRSDGMYMFRYTDSNGKRKAVYSWKLVSTDRVPDGKRCKEALRDIEKHIQRDINDGICTADASVVTVDALFASFMELRSDLKQTTRSNYQCLYNTHVHELLGHKTVDKVKFSTIQKLYTGMIQDHGLKTSTVQSVHAILYQIFERAVMDNLIRTNPCGNVLKSLRKMLNYEPEKRHALTEEQQSRLIDYVYNTRQFQKWGALLTVLLGTGMRISEVLGLRWDDCNFDKGIISVNHSLLYKTDAEGKYEYRISSPKTKAGLRFIPMFADVKEALLNEQTKWRNPENEQFAVDGLTNFIFTNSNGKVFTPAYIFDVIQNITSTYNHEELFNATTEGREPELLPKISAHIFRHTFCTRLCENEPNIKVIQDVMGHKNIRTTMDVYNEATEAKKLASFQDLEGKIKLA